MDYGYRLWTKGYGLWGMDLAMNLAMAMALAPVR